jgi:hypothetical protein
VFVGVDGAEWDIRVTSTTGDPPRDLLATKDTERTARLSPSGRWLAYESNRSGRDEIWVAPYPPDGGAPVRVSRDGGKQPVWSHNGRELYYLQSNRLMAAAVETSKAELTFKRAVELFAIPLVIDGAYDVAEDGRFLTIRPTSSSSPPSEPIVVVQNWHEELKPTRAGRLTHRNQRAVRRHLCELHAPILSQIPSFRRRFKTVTAKEFRSAVSARRNAGRCAVGRSRDRS